MKVTFAVTVEIDEQEAKEMVQTFVESKLEKQLSDLIDLINKEVDHNKIKLTPTPSGPSSETPTDANLD